MISTFFNCRQRTRRGHFNEGRRMVKISLLLLSLFVLFQNGSSRLGDPTEANNNLDQVRDSGFSSSLHINTNDVQFSNHPRDDETNNNDENAGVKVSTIFPPYTDTFELARLSSLIYGFLGQDSCNATNQDGTPLIPSDLQCHMYIHDHHQGTQVMIVSSSTKQYVAVVFAGTDDVRTSLVDGDILTTPFDLLPSNEDIRVHAGFDHAVFKDGLFDKILDTVNTARKDLQTKEKRKYRILTTGHSLGAADSILTAVALKLNYPPEEYILSVNFGSPRTGNRPWRDYVNGIDNLGIWRFVHGNDIVPRLPDGRFVHVGHTVQMSRTACRAYYLHDGNETLGYAGVPYGWSAKPFIWVPGAVHAHFISLYVAYLRDQSGPNPDTFYVHDFEKTTAKNDTDDDDYIPDPPDDENFVLWDEEWDDEYAWSSNEYSETPDVSDVVDTKDVSSSETERLAAGGDEKEWEIPIAAETYR